VNRKILIADDEPHILHVVSMKLRNAGYEVITAVDGAEALELCASEKPDLLITDFHMPVISGMELCKQLRRSAETKDIPTILLTARGFDITSDEMVEAGVQMVLGKPFSPSELLKKAEQLLAQRAGAAGEG
jgi:CheY-like chemotaxis protein